MESEVTTTVFTASIDNQGAIEEWLQTIRDQTNDADQALARLGHTLRRNPHISITLRANNDVTE